MDKDYSSGRRLDNLFRLANSELSRSIYEPCRLYKIKWNFQIHVSIKNTILSWNQGKKLSQIKCFRCHSPWSIWSHLQVSALGLEPVINEALWVSREAQHELPLSLQMVNGFDGLMDLRDQASIHVGSWLPLYNILIKQQLVLVY